MKPISAMILLFLFAFYACKQTQPQGSETESIQGEVFRFPKICQNEKSWVPEKCGMDPTKNENLTGKVVVTTQLPIEDSLKKRLASANFDVCAGWVFYYDSKKGWDKGIGFWSNEFPLKFITREPGCSPGVQFHLRRDPGNNSLNETLFYYGKDSFGKDVYDYSKNMINLVEVVGGDFFTLENGFITELCTGKKHDNCIVVPTNDKGRFKIDRLPSSR